MTIFSMVWCADVMCSYVWSKIFYFKILLNGLRASLPLWLWLVSCFIFFQSWNSSFCYFVFKFCLPFALTMCLYICANACLKCLMNQWMDVMWSWTMIFQWPPYSPTQQLFFKFFPPCHVKTIKIQFGSS